MTTIKATCPACGDVELSPVDLAVIDSGTCASYTFSCPDCLAQVTKTAGREIVALLVEAGVSIQSPRSLAPAPLTYDDVLDFALALEQTSDVLGALLALDPR
ncbi:MAG: hypothetical protein WCJ42_06045 [Actinomycetes bacterium]